MKSKLLTLLLCGLLTLSLAGCGEKKNMGHDDDVMGDNGVTTPTDKSDNSSDGGIDTGDNADETDVMGDSGVKDPSAVKENAADNNQDMASGNNNGAGNGTDSKSTANTATNAWGGSINPANGNATRGVSWEHMVENGHVRDRDGNLLDNENSHWTF